MKLANGIRFTDKAIANVRHADIVFTYTDQNGQVKTKPFVDIPFKNLKHTRLKGLNLRVFRNGGIYFIVRYWFQKKTKTLTLGESIPGMFGKKQVEDKLYELTDTHLNDNGHWEKDPLITEKDKTRVITDTQFTESKKKTINELIVACLKANLPKGKGGSSSDGVANSGSTISFSVYC